MDLSGEDWPQVIAHADIDAFYASVEQLDDASLRGKPVIVGGSGARGVVTSASYEARPFGVHAAMPTAQARKLCPQAIFVRGRMRRYAELSRAVRAVFDSFTPMVEPLSLDEAFLDLTGTQRIHGAPLEAGRELKRRVHEVTGLVVSVGIAPVKMVAKILSDMSKPDGLRMIGPQDVEEFLNPLPVERLWGVGRVTLERLNREGIRTIGDLARSEPSALRSHLGSLGAHLHELARGHDPRVVVGGWQRKSYAEENTFEQDQPADSIEVRRTIVAHGEALGRRLREDGVRARTVVLKLKLTRPLGGGRYPLLTRSWSLEHATDDGGRIVEAAVHMLEKARSEATSVRLVGVGVHNLERPQASQLGLFEAAAPEAKRTRLNRALDKIDQRFGEGTVTRGLARAERAAPSTRIK